jgi:hypothetical protein
MNYRGSCHCGKIAYDVEGVIEQVMECNCSHCSRKGFLLWFVDRDKLTVTTPENQLATYTFNKHVIKHHFCGTCGCAPFGIGKHPSGKLMAAINVRCLEGIDHTKLKVVQVNGKNF